MLSDMIDKNKKIANSFWSTNCVNKLSELGKSAKWWVVNALKCEKEMHKVFHCNDIAFNKKGSCSRSKSRNKIHLP